MTVSGPPDLLVDLAVARGVAVSYEDSFHRMRTVSPDTLVAILATLGEPIERPSDAAECLARRAAMPEALSPVAVAWDGDLRAGALADLTRVAGLCSENLRIELEDGSSASDLVDVVGAGLGLRRALPFGMHTLLAGETKMLVISAPRRARSLEPRSWGVFAPTYALWDERQRQIGDLSCLGRLGSFAGSLGASYLATLPLLADYSTADSPDAVASPYSPVSRMWWNEAYLDLSAVPGAGVLALPAARSARPTPSGGSAGGSAAGPAARSAARPAARAAAGRAVTPASIDRYADIAEAAAGVDAALAQLIAVAHPGAGSRKSAYEQFRRERTDVVRYATFRAAAKAGGIYPDRWPARWIAGDIRPGQDVAPADMELHVCAQWLTDEQVAGVTASTKAAGCRLMLDLPIGCRPNGYDAWAYPSSFAGGSAGVHRQATVGAPPDRFFHAGQNWGFRPLDPQGERAAGYPVLGGALKHLLRHAGAVRIDHILGFQRLWWIPAGASASEGTYVSYPTDELVALACLEAWRRDATLIGEDLGTVDPAVRQAMSEHGIAGTRVAIFELEAGSSAPLQPTPGSCALVDTHDTATFAGFVDGSDIDQRLELGLVDETEAQAQHRSRAQARNALSERFGEIDDDPASLHAGVLEELGRSEAGVVMAGIEDFWAEHDPQNIPGTLGAHRNFARRMSEPLQVIETDTAVTGPLLRLAAARRSAPEPVHTAPEPVERAAPVGRATGGQHAAGACTGLGEGKVSA